MFPSVKITLSICTGSNTNASRYVCQVLLLRCEHVGGLTMLTDTPLKIIIIMWLFCFSAVTQCSCEN